MSEIYESLGIVPIVNAKGTATRLSGAPMRPEVAAAMAEASRVCIDIVELQAVAAKRIATVTGAESGLVTSGAAAGLLLGTAACITGLDPAAMARLPDTTGLKDEVVMVRGQRNQYDHALRTTGTRIVEVGLPDRLNGAGCRDAEPWEIAAAIGPRTAAVHWVADGLARPSLAAVVEVAHAHKVPVIVDAAAQLPPKSNLEAFIATGADLVAFSGGKAIGGPQGSGILCGRRDLIMAAALQMLDMDYPEGAFAPPRDFLDTSRLAGLPPHGIGRPCKVGKEQIVGLLTALELFVTEDEAARQAGWLAAVRALAQGLGDLPSYRLGVRDSGAVPVLTLAPDGGRDAAAALYRQLLEGTPVIHVDPEEIDRGRLIFNPIALVPGDVERITARLQEIGAAR